MRAALLLVLATAAATADEASTAKAKELAKAGPAAAREAIPELIALGKGAPAERFAARDALAIAGPPAVAKLIEGAAGDGSLRLLLEGVSFDLGAGVVVVALPALASKDPKVRAMAAVSLGAAGAGGEAALKQLDTALHDPDPEVRREAALALGGIGRGAHDAIPGLIHLANDPERGMTREALLALGMIVRDAAERERPAAKLSPEIAGAIERGLKWLAAEQQPEGSWEVPAADDVVDLRKARVHVTSLTLLAMLDSGAPDRHSPQLRSGLRYLVAEGDYRFDRPWWVIRAPVVAALCAAARVLDEPECRAAAERAVADIAAGDHPQSGAAWHALADLEARFAGLVRMPSISEIADAGPIDTALVYVVAGEDPKSDKLRGVIEACGRGGWADPEAWPLAARARWYAGERSDALLESVRKGQQDDGRWFTKAPDPHGTALRTACSVLCLEAAAGLAHPLTMPLPDAPRFRAAVATLRIARQSKDDAIRAAAEQALAGFR